LYQFNVTVLAMNALFLHMLLYFVRNKTSIIIVMYSVFIFFSLSLWNTSKALTIFRKDKRSYGSVCNGIQRFDSSQFYRRKRIFCIYYWWEVGSDTLQTCLDMDCNWISSQSDSWYPHLWRKKHVCSKSIIFIL